MTEVKSLDTITLFYCYAEADKRYLSELEKHLTSLRQKGLVEDWADHKVLPGVERDPLIEKYLKTADIILLLISKDFTSSDYCCNALIKALERHKAGEMHGPSLF